MEISTYIKKAQAKDYWGVGISPEGRIVYFVTENDYHLCIDLLAYYNLMWCKE